MSQQSILVSNDDGIEAAGLLVLTQQLNTALKNTLVYVCCPSTERSTQSQALTIGKPLKIMKREVEGAEVAWAVVGTPADSMALAFNSNLFENYPEFDLVVSGINRGENLGWHAHYSGTLAAARQAVFRGKIGIAFSLDNLKAKQPSEFETAARLSAPLVQALLGKFPPTNGYIDNQEWRQNLQGKLLLNVNFPNLPYDEIKGYYLSYQGHSCNFSNYRVVEQPSDSEIIYKAGGASFQEENRLDSDYGVVKQGWISIVPLTMCQSMIIPEEEKQLQKVVLKIIIPLFKQMSDAVGKQFQISKAYLEILDQSKDIASL